MSEYDSTETTQTSSNQLSGPIRFLVLLILGPAIGLAIIMLFPILVLVVDLLLGLGLLYILIVVLPKSLYIAGKGSPKQSWKDGLENEIRFTRRTFSGLRNTPSGEVVN